MALLTALTGGIGAGKSVVSRILRTMGYPVFDCDSEARALMDADSRIKERIAAEIAAEAIAGSDIDRRRLAEIVFADAAKLEILNSIVHAAVKERLAQWVESEVKSEEVRVKSEEVRVKSEEVRVKGEEVRVKSGEPMLFVETAILYQSGLNRLVDSEWCVEAPMELRIDRVMNRNGLTRSQVEDRIASQHFEIPDGEPRPFRSLIFNDGINAVLPQIQALLM